MYLLLMWSMINLINSFPQRFLLQTVAKTGSSRTLFHNSLCNRSNIERLCRTVSRPVTSIKSMDLELEAQTIEDMEDVGAILGIGSQKGDVILLDGDLGAGKTCFSRGFVRAKTGYMDLRVTSPTYLLSNTYPVKGDDNDEIVIHHMDLYRLSEGEDFSPLNLDYVLKQGISLIEWPSRLGKGLPNERLEIIIKIDKDYDSVTDKNDDDESEETPRTLYLKPYGERWEERLASIQESGYLDDLIVEYENDEN